MDRAYSLLHIKAVDAERRTITGLATSPTPDRVGDIVEPLGVKFKNPLPLLLYHDATQPIGTVRFKAPTAAGIEFEATLPAIASPASLHDRIETAWASIKAGLLKGVSIGFRSIEHAMMKDGIRFLKTEVLELSLVSIPANQDATIHTIKSFDRSEPASRQRSVSFIPGVTGSRHEKTAMNVSELLTAESSALQTKASRLEELMTDDLTGNGLDATDAAERDKLAGEVEAHTKKVSQLKTLELAQASRSHAVIVPFAPVREKAIHQVKMVEIEPATIFVRAAMAIAAGRGSHSDTLAYAKRWTSETQAILDCIKAVEGTAVVASPGWGGELVNPNTASTAFVELLRAATLIGRIPGFRMVPFNIPIIEQTAGSTFEWVGEAGKKPVGELAFTRTVLTWSKVAGIVVLSEELIRFSQPSAEATVRNDLIRQGARFIDEQFIQSSVTAGPNNPASITAGAPSSSATGTDVTALLADLNTALATFDSANVSTEGLVMTMTPALARGISTLLSPLGNQQMFPGMTPSGGTLLGYPVFVSNSVDAGTIVIFKPSEIFLADDGAITLSSSNQATLDMGSGSPEAPTFNLWQRNCVGIRAERFIRWQPARADVVVLITDAAYGPAVGSP